MMVFSIFILSSNVGVQARRTLCDVACNPLFEPIFIGCSRSCSKLFRRRRRSIPQLWSSTVHFSFRTLAFTLGACLVRRKVQHFVGISFFGCSISHPKREWAGRIIAALPATGSIGFIGSNIIVIPTSAFRLRRLVADSLERLVRGDFIAFRQDSYSRRQNMRRC